MSAETHPLGSEPTGSGSPFSPGGGMQSVASLPCDLRIVAGVSEKERAVCIDF